MSNAANQPLKGNRAARVKAMRLRALPTLELTKAQGANAKHFHRSGQRATRVVFLQPFSIKRRDRRRAVCGPQANTRQQRQANCRVRSLSQPLRGYRKLSAATPCNSSARRARGLRRSSTGAAGAQKPLIVLPTIQRLKNVNLSSNEDSYKISVFD